MSRQTIGDNPLDALLEVNPEMNPKKKINGVEKLVQKSNSGGNGKQRLTVQISEGVIERVKDAVYWTRGLTLAQLTEQGA